MADKKISELTSLTSPADADEIEIIDKSDNSMAASGTNKKITAVNLIPDATETIKGKAELATDTEAQTGTDTTRVITPANLTSVLSVLEDGWIKYSGTMPTFTSTTTGRDTLGWTVDNTGNVQAGEWCKITSTAGTDLIYKVYSITATTLVVVGEVSVSGTITAISFSKQYAPQGATPWEGLFKSRTTLSSPQSITSSTTTRIQLDTEVFDTNNDFDTVTDNVYWIPVTGYFSFKVVCRADGGATRAFATVELNGTDQSRGVDSTATVYGQEFQETFYVQRGWYVGARGFITDASSPVFYTGSSMTTQFISI